MAIAATANLSTSNFSACYADTGRTAAIEADMAEGLRREVNSTPTFFIGDTRLVGSDQLAADGARTIEKALRQ